MSGFVPPPMKTSAYYVVDCPECETRCESVTLSFRCPQCGCAFRVDSGGNEKVTKKGHV